MPPSPLLLMVLTFVYFARLSVSRPKRPTVPLPSIVPSMTQAPRTRIITGRLPWSDRVAPLLSVKLSYS